MRASAPTTPARRQACGSLAITAALAANALWFNSAFHRDEFLAALPRFPEDAPLPGICTSAAVRLHPVTTDEDAVFVPFASLGRALDFARECAMRRIGLAIGVLGGESTALSLGRPFPFQFPSGSPFQQPPPSGAIYQPPPPAVAPGAGPTMPLPLAASPAGMMPPAVPPSFGMPAPAVPYHAPVPPQPMGGWRATHRVPLGGLPARRKPDPTLPMLMRIAEGVQLMVARPQGEWALVQTDQGWQAWVDGRRLEPIVPETPQ